MIKQISLSIIVYLAALPALYAASPSADLGKATTVDRDIAMAQASPDTVSSSSLLPSSAPLMADVSEDSHRQKRKLENPSQLESSPVVASGCVNASPFRCPRSVDSLEGQQYDLEEKIFPTELEATDLDTDGQMFTGKKWVAWVRRLFDEPVNKVVNNNGTMLTIREPRCPEVIINKLVMACTRHPDAVTELQTIAKCYFTDIPEDLRLWNLDDQQKCVETGGKKNKIIEFGKLIHEARGKKQDMDAVAHDRYSTLKAELLTCVETAKPYCIANYILERIGCANFSLPPMPFMHKLHGLAPLCDCMTVWFLEQKHIPASQRFAQYLKRMCEAYIPHIYQRLNEHTSQAAACNKVKIESFLITPFAPLTAGNAYVENEYIWLLQQNAKQVRSCLAGEIMRGHSIPREKLDEARLRVEKQLSDFLSERKKSMLDTAQKTTDQRAKNLLFLRSAVLSKLQLSEGLVPPLAACREIACYIDRATENARMPEVIKEGIGFASRAITLAGSACGRNDLNCAADLNIRLANMLPKHEQLAYVKKYALLRQRAVSEFPSLASRRDWYNAAAALSDLLHEYVESGNRADAIATCRAAIPYLDKSHGLIPQSDEEELRKSLPKIELFCAQLRSMASKLIDRDVQLFAERADNYINAIKRKMNPIDLPD